MIFLIIATIWLSIGAVTFLLIDSAFKIYWLEKFDEHYEDTDFYDPKIRGIFFIMFAIGGLFSPIMFMIVNDNDYYSLKKSNFMLFYNRDKAEKLVRK